MWSLVASYAIGFLSGAISMLFFAGLLIRGVDAHQDNLEYWRAIMINNISAHELAPRRGRDESERKSDADLADSDGLPLEDREEWDLAEVEKRGEEDRDD